MFFDLTILVALTKFCGLHPGFDRLLVASQGNTLLKGGVFVALLWLLWFRAESAGIRGQQVHERICSTLLAMAVGVLVARLAAHVLPFRVRPLADAELRLPFPASFTGLASWSSFPTDHAVVWFALAFGTLGIDRKLGCIALVYAAILRAARVYCGIHHPIDILAGAVIGACTIWLFGRARFPAVLYAPFADARARFPGPFYALAFLLTFEIANLLDNVHTMGSVTLTVISGHVP